LRNVTLKAKTMMKAPDINLDEYMPSAAPKPAPAPSVEDEDEGQYEYACVNKEHLLARAMFGTWQIQNGMYKDDKEVMRIIKERYKD